MCNVLQFATCYILCKFCICSKCYSYAAQQWRIASNASHEPRPRAQKDAEDEQNVAVAAVDALPHEEERASEGGVREPLAEETEEHEVSVEATVIKTENRLKC